MMELYGTQATFVRQINVASGLFMGFLCITYLILPKSITTRQYQLDIVWAIRYTNIVLNITFTSEFFIIISDTTPSAVLLKQGFRRLFDAAFY